MSDNGHGNAEEVLSCNGVDENSSELASIGHPKIYLKVPKGETRPCPYCGKLLGADKH